MRVAGDPPGVGEWSTVVGPGEPRALESCWLFPAPRLCDEWGSGKFLSWLIFSPLNSTPSERHVMPMMSMMVKNFFGEVFPGLC